MKTSDLKKIAILDVSKAIKEDLGKKDLTTNLLSSRRKDVVRAFVIANENSILCGQIWFATAFDQIKRKYKGTAKIKWLRKDGETIKKGQKICQIIASREIVLTAERTALNFIQMLSGISTKTNKYVRKLNNKKIKILDTRKTIPGLRFCQKYAVKIGGGYNHRSGLYDQVLFKENHISSFESFSDFILSTQKKINLRKVSIEVENLRDLQILCKYNPKNILLDNFSISQIKKAIKLCSNSKSSIEISGNISLSNIGSFKGLKIDYISIGDLTKNVESIDFSLLIEK